MIIMFLTIMDSTIMLIIIILIMLRNITPIPRKRIITPNLLVLTRKDPFPNGYLKMFALDFAGRSCVSYGLRLRLSQTHDRGRGPSHSLQELYLVRSFFFFGNNSRGNV